MLVIKNHKPYIQYADCLQLLAIVSALNPPSYVTGGIFMQRKTIIKCLRHSAQNMFHPSNPATFQFENLFIINSKQLKATLLPFPSE